MEQPDGNPTPDRLARFPSCYGGLSAARQRCGPNELRPAVQRHPPAAAERENWRLLGGVYAVEWPDLDGHTGV